VFRHTIPIGRVLGIPIDLDYSWFLIAVLTTWVRAVSLTSALVGANCFVCKGLSFHSVTMSPVHAKS